MTRHRRLANAVRKLGRSATVSARALIRRLPTEALLAQEGISPQRRYAGCRPSSFVTASTGCVGAMLYLGEWGSSMSKNSNRRWMSSKSAAKLYLPHMAIPKKPLNKSSARPFPYLTSRNPQTYSEYSQEVPGLNGLVKQGRI